jgi:hypothetical protein
MLITNKGNIQDKKEQQNLHILQNKTNKQHDESFNSKF